jgi:5'-methylthioadenosine nucleosidase
MVQPILILMAMEAEAAPVAGALGLGPHENLHPRLPARVRVGDTSGSRVILVTHGLDERFGVDAIGTQPAAVTAWVAATHYKPRLIVNAGTAGGFSRHGGAIGDVYLSHGPVVYHHRRIPLGSFEPYGIGSYPSMDAGPLAKALNLKIGRLSTGDALDISDADARAIEASGASIKDMEGAAIAWVAALVGAPFLAVKSITDLVDGAHPTADQFIENLDHAVSRLAEVLPRLIHLLARSD